MSEKWKLLWKCQKSWHLKMKFQAVVIYLFTWKWQEHSLTMCEIDSLKNDMLFSLNFESVRLQTDLMIASIATVEL